MATKKNNKDNENKQLYYLNELSDYKISSDDPDVRGWEVRDADNRVIGKVDNLLVNKRTERVVYLDVEVDSSIIEANHDPYGQPSNAEVHEFINKDGENHIIIPVGLVNLNEDKNFVYTDSIDHRTFSETKRMGKGTSVNRDYEVVVLNSYNRNENRDKTIDRDSRYDSDRDIRERDRDSDRVTNTRVTNSRQDEPAFDNDRDRDASFRDQDREKSRRGDWNDDDDFYERREFDGSNYRRRR